ncbi:MAG TPA: protein kinase [Terriglobales bacterium]|nr:protein kinase [Terriglobales bacterium]
MTPPEGADYTACTRRGGGMALQAGSRLGHYEITGVLGAGGMGEVYRARDTRLGREVALKVLPDALAYGRTGRERFEQEARSASALNHPNIVTIYELAQADSIHYIAMELVEGETLRQKLERGPLPLRKALEVAAQVAEGLAKAHESGIVHRDLKPENVIVPREGPVKILDFGLAKPAAPSLPGVSQISTQGFATSPGAVMGTAAYMSPEQAGGQPLDFRSDQFSFGLMLYEMVTGSRAFQRHTTAETMAAIIREEPEPMRARNPALPAPLCWMTERCLAKDPKERYVSTRDLAREVAALRDRLADLPQESPEARRPSNLPVASTALVGREREVAAASELLLGAEVRLVTVTGPGGIGKTRLALEVARALEPRFPAGVYFVPLAGVSDLRLIASVIAQTLGLRESSGRSPQEELKRYLQESLRAPLLLVFDNFEHLLAAAPLVAELLALGGSLKILVTSRAALHLSGEHEFPVPALALPEARARLSPEALAQCPAVALFVQRARAVKPDFTLSGDNAGAVAEICERLDGLPLAIELAAARVKLLSPAAMRTRLESRLQLLTGGARDLPARQQTLRGAMDWSYELLTPAEQKLFRRLAVFAGGATLEAAEAACDTKSDLGVDILEGMASLVDKSLVQQQEQEGGEPRFLMLETVREYALEHLAAQGEEAATRRAHAAYCLVLAEELDAADAAAEAGQAERLDHLESEHDNLRGALDWLAASGQAEWCLRLGAALFHFWERRDYLSEGREQLARALGPAGAAASKARSRALFAAGVLAGSQGDYASNQRLMEASLAMARQLGDKQGIAVSLNALAVNARDREDVASERALFEESLAVWREAGDPQAVARALSNLANVVRLQGDYEHARSLYQECMAAFRELGDRGGVAWSLDHLGDVARDQGDAAGARSLYEASLTAFRESGDLWGVAGALADLGGLAQGQGDYAGAHALYGESLKVFQELGHKRGVARLLECFAASAGAQGQAERALRLAGAAAALRHAIGAALTPPERAALETTLASARAALDHASGTSAWLEGWALPVEQAIAEAQAGPAQG